MPDKAAHLRKYEENRRLLNTKLSIENEEFYNWIVTVAFYTAMHLVEARLAEDEIHSCDHSARGNNVERFNCFKPIRAEYKMLYDRSRVARYDAAFMNDKKTRKVLDCLDVIEKQVQIADVHKTDEP